MIDTPGERALAAVPWIGMAAGIGGTALAPGNPATPWLFGVSAGAAGIGVAQRGYSLYDRSQHGQTWTEWSNSEVRDAYIGGAADLLTVGSALKFQGLRPGLVSATDEISTARRWVMIGSQYADTAATVNTGLTAAQQYDQMTPEQRLAVFGQMGFWLSMTALSARRAGGLGNLYGRQDIGNLLRRGRAQRALSGEIPPEGRTILDSTIPPNTRTQTPPGTLEPPKAPAGTPAATAVTLRANYQSQGHVFDVVDNKVSINGQINLSPERVAQLQADGQLDNVLLVSRALNSYQVRGDYNNLSPADRKVFDNLVSANRDPKVNGQRLRFNYQLNQEVNTFLQQHGVESQPVFRNMSEADRARLFDVINERPKQLPKDPRQVQALDLEEQQSVNYALSQKPQSVGEFVEQVQMYKAVVAAENRSRLARYNAEIQRILQRDYGTTDLKSLTTKQQTKVRERASLDIFGRAFDGKDAASREAYIQAVESAGVTNSPGQVKPQMQAKVAQVYDQLASQFRDRLGSVGGINPHQDSAALQQQIQQLNAEGRVRFASELTATYHVAKHYEAEFPTGERQPGKTNVENYLASASRTVSNPTSTSVGYDQAGNRVIIYEREIPGNEPGKILIGRAIVRVSRNGEMSLASYYIPGEKPKPKPAQGNNP